MQRAPHILLIDDASRIRDVFAAFLRINGLRVSTAASGQAMRAQIAENAFDLIVLDLMLTGEDGLRLLRGLRAVGSVPVLALAAVGEASARIADLPLGAEDHMCRPFSLRELLARIHSMLRQQSWAGNRIEPDPVFRFQGWALDVRARMLMSPRGREIELTIGEFELLRAFVEHPNRVLNRDQLLSFARRRSSLAIGRSIDVRIMRLRRKIEPGPDAPRLIETVRNAGYVFTAVVSRSLCDPPSQG
jgi:two-component system, OmpR family, response regulator